MTQDAFPCVTEWAELKSLYSQNVLATWEQLNTLPQCFCYGKYTWEQWWLVNVGRKLYLVNFCVNTYTSLWAPLAKWVFTLDTPTFIGSELVDYATGSQPEVL